MRIRLLLVALTLPGALLAQTGAPPSVLPARATVRLAESLEAARAHQRHVWRDTAPINADGTVNAYIEIPKGERRKWEFDMRANARAVDRVIPREIGGYPVNYGYVPQTISYDGDPFDVLVLGPALPGGQLVRGVIVGVMYMEDEKGLDSKVVLSPLDVKGRPRYALTRQERDTIGEYFRGYKRGQPGQFSRVPGWGAAAEGEAYVKVTHAFFETCRTPQGSACEIAR